MGERAGEEKGKPVLVRIKRKICQEQLDSFWLEINERPLKKALLSFNDLSISHSSGKEKSTSRRFLMRHVDTLERSEDIVDSVVPFLIGDSDVGERFRRIEERRNMFKQINIKQNQFRSAAMQRHEDMAKSARFEQILKRRNTRQESDVSLHERCHLFDVVRIDGEEEMVEEVQEPEDVSVDGDDVEILSNYLPLLKEFLPSAAADIEREVISKIGDHVYDIYTACDVDDDCNNDFKDQLLLVVDDGDYFDNDGGVSGSDHDTDDSNAENSDLNDYPDEPSSNSEEQSVDENEDSNDDSEESSFVYESESEGLGQKDLDSKYQGPVDVKELEMEIEELRGRYV